jgi:hypothetical protein
MSEELYTESEGGAGVKGGHESMAEPDNSHWGAAKIFFGVLKFSPH